MKNNHGAYIVCPHCRERIAIRVDAPQKKGAIKWADIDWSKPSGKIAKETGMARSTVAMMRTKHAPETVGKIAPQAKYDWASVDWSQDNATICKATGAPQSYISQQRQRFAPGTVRLRKPSP